MNLEALTQQVTSIAKEVGSFIRAESKLFKSSQIEYKGLNDLVSYVDKEAEKKIVESLLLLLPDAGFITEEKTVSRKGTTFTWIVDPLDGTTNFIHGLPAYSVSIALQQDDRLILGVVYEINRDECFYAWKGGGTYMNGVPVRVASNKELSESLIATGFPYYEFDLLEKYINVFRDLTQVCHGLRRVGSAAVDLAYVACGRYDGYFEYNINSYDIAAGIVLVEEAGGKVFNFDGSDLSFETREVIAANASIQVRLGEVIRRYF